MNRRIMAPGTPVNFDIPDGACDCHTHIFGDPRRFPLSISRTYTPEPALPDELRALHRTLGIQRVVIVTPSVYAADNSATLDGLQQLGRKARGIAVVDDQTTERELDDLHLAGFRGIRLNLATEGVSDLAVAGRRLQRAIDRMANRNWHVQVFTTLPMIAALANVIVESPVPVVVDHFGGAVADLGTSQPGFSELLELVQTGKIFVKLSAAYRISRRSPNYEDVLPLAQALIQANPDRMLWGTDWPHPDAVPPAGRSVTDPGPRLLIDDGCLLNQLARWAPTPDLREKILVVNPARLYGF